ncbi:MAG TPA: hypothetical protein VFJ45_12270 [bacterium]|nr:hypothetical protein [bacterium]
MQKLALILLGVMAFSAASVGVASATSFTAETTDLSLPGYLQYVTVCGSLVGSWGE